jgi:hypothetical protein
MRYIMEDAERTVITPHDINEKLSKLPYTREELLEWERWGNENFGYPERKR